MEILMEVHKMILHFMIMIWHGVMSRAIGIEKARLDIRAWTNISTILSPRGIASSYKTMPFISLLDEDEKMWWWKWWWWCWFGGFGGWVMIDYFEQICHPSVFEWCFELCTHIFACWIVANFMFCFGNIGFGYVLAIMMLSFYAWSSLFLCFLFIRLQFWIIFDNTCA